MIIIFCKLWFNTNLNFNTQPGIAPSLRINIDMLERDRKRLENYYASKHSFLLDLKILLKTFPALLQKEKVYKRKL